MTEENVCHVCGQPGFWTSPTGHIWCQEHYDIMEDSLERLYGSQEGLQPVDLRKLMSGSPPEEEWLAEPLLPKGKLCGIVARRGTGKSLLLLDIAAALATGQEILGYRAAGEAISTVFVDMEMGPDDLYERLADLGYVQDHPAFDLLCRNLHYYQLVALPPLNTEEGGNALEELVERHQAKLVVIDTVSRVVTGAENDAEPYRELFRHTETMLKRKGVTLARLDHLGKDTARGSRGSSAKEDPLDVVWQLEEGVAEGTLVLSLTKGRQSWIQRQVTVYREDHEGVTAHRLHIERVEAWVADLIERMDQIGLPVTAGVNKAFQALKEANLGANRAKLSTAVRVRKRSAGGSKMLVPLAGTTQNGKFGTTLGTTQVPLSETLIDTGENLVPPGGTTQVPLVPSLYPPKGGTTWQSEAETDDFEPDPDELLAFAEELDNVDPAEGFGKR